MGKYALAIKRYETALEKWNSVKWKYEKHELEQELHDAYNAIFAAAFDSHWDDEDRLAHDRLEEAIQTKIEQKARDRAGNSQK